jgi:hypothetical protein
MHKKAMILALLAVSPAVLAHHGFGSFDMDEEIELTGSVTELAFVNPHSWLYLDVMQADGSVESFRCEMRSATTLRRSGWTTDMFPAGLEVRILGSPDRNDPNACYVSTIIFEDGSTIDRYGQRTPPVETVSRRGGDRLTSGEPDISGDWGAEQLVMSDPRGVGGSLVPLSEAEAIGDRDRSAGAGRGAGVPLITGGAAQRLYIGNVPLTEAGEAAQAAARADTNPAMRCEPISIVMDWTYDAPVNRITQTGETIVLEYGKFDYSRTIYLDQPDHPQELESSLTGHSIGRWEGDVLIVDTVGIRAGPLTRGIINSDSLHLIERFSIDAETMALTREFEATDPEYFQESYTGTDVVYPSNVPYAPSPCDDRSLF